MGNKTNRLTVFENIIDHIENSDDHTTAIKQAIQIKNTPYLFIALTMYNVTTSSDYGTLKLTYNELVKKYKPFNNEQLKIINSHACVLDVSSLCLLKNKYIDAYNKITKGDIEMCQCAQNAIIDGDYDTLVMLIKGFGFYMNSCSNVEEHFTIGELLELYKEDPYWSVLYKFINKGYHYERLNEFILGGLAKKKEMFEIYKLLYFYDIPGILDSIMSFMFDVEDEDVYQVVAFNKLLKQEKNFDEVFECIYSLEKYKVFWLWLKEHEVIKDVVGCIFSVLMDDAYDVTISKYFLGTSKIPLLFL